MAADEGSRESVDAGCRNLTASWVREKASNDPVVELCDFFEGLEKAGQDVCPHPHLRPRPYPCPCPCSCLCPLPLCGAIIDLLAPDAPGYIIIRALVFQRCNMYMYSR